MGCSQVVKSLTISEERALSGWCCLTGLLPDGCVSTDDINQEEAGSFFFFSFFKLRFEL